MNILLKEILKQQRALGEFSGAIKGILLHQIHLSDTAIKLKVEALLEKLNSDKFSDEFWEAIVEYNKLKQKEDEE